jgi:O-succinylbenzoic acid--CoA ligase
MRNLVALALPGGPEFVVALQRAWDADDAVVVLDPRVPPKAQADVLNTLAVSEIVADDGTTAMPGGRRMEDGDALVVTTSGTTGRPKAVVLTHDAGGGVGAAPRAPASVSTHAATIGSRACRWPMSAGSRWSRARSSRAPPSPSIPASTRPPPWRAAPPWSRSCPRRWRGSDPARFRTIVLGGAAPPADLPANAVTTYGLTETGSGVVYDGRPLDGVEVRIGPDGEVQLRGPMLLRAYLDGTDPKDADGWLATGDLGHIDDGRLVVDGRRDDLIVTGGENCVARAGGAGAGLAPGVAAVAVAGPADAEWGQRVTAYVVAADPARPPTLADLRARVKRRYRRGARRGSWCWWTTCRARRSARYGVIS